MSAKFFALLDNENIVKFVTQATDAQYLTDTFGGRWVETHINTPRKFYAMPGYLYLEEDDNFLPPAESFSENPLDENGNIIGW
jgi:hypothetical protein